jgi:hypothetical protein
VVVVSVEPYTVGTASEVLVVCVVGLGVATYVQLARWASALRDAREMMMFFMMVSVLLGYPAAYATDGS